MYNTPINAKQMLCPNNNEFLSHFGGLIDGKCIADMCMAWRVTGGRIWGSGKDTITEGFCGIYGKP